MIEVFRAIIGMPVPFNMVVVIVLIGCIAGVLTSIVKQIRKYASLRHELEFKRELVERGLSVDEIERIVRAQSSNSARDSDTVSPST
jgi:hypothetical protein